MVKLLLDARVALTPNKLQPLVPTNLLYTPVHTNFATPISGLTPKMDRVCSVNSAASVTPFMENFYFLDSQSSFDTIFSSYPLMIGLSKRG